MKQLETILIPTDLSEYSRRALVYGCWLATKEKTSSLIILRVANELHAWEFYSDELSFVQVDRNWPIDRVLAEASLDLSRFLEPSMASLEKCPRASKRVVLGPIAQQIAAVAEKEKADLVIMSPRRDATLRHWFFGSVTDTVTRLSPCPVLSIAEPLPSKPCAAGSSRNISGGRDRERSTLRDSLALADNNFTCSVLLPINKSVA